MSNYPDGALDNPNAPYNEKSYEIKFEVTFTGSLYNDKYYKEELEEIKKVLKDELLGLFSAVQVKEL